MADLKSSNVLQERHLRYVRFARYSYEQVAYGFPFSS